MSNGVVKIGVTTNLEKRIPSVKGFLDVIRVHSTSFAPRSFMYDLEKHCHAVFERNRVRSEYFAITFEEAVAEHDSHAEEIADALKKADEKTIEEIKYVYNELVPELYKIYDSENLEPDLMTELKQAYLEWGKELAMLECVHPKESTIKAKRISPFVSCNFAWAVLSAVIFLAE